MPITGAVLFIACLHSTAQQPDLQQPVSYTTKAAPLPRVLKQLTAKTGVGLDCDTQLDEEPIILLFDKVPLRTAMDKIAGAFGGEWIKNDKGYKLQFGKQADDMHEAIVKSRQEKIQKKIDKIINDPDILGAYTQDHAERFVKNVGDHISGKVIDHSDFHQLHKDTPTRRLYAKVLSRIDWYAVAELTRNHNITFSNLPNQGERQLTNVDQDLDEFLSSQALMTNAIKNYPTTPENTKVIFGNLGRSPKTQDPLRIVLSIQMREGQMLGLGFWVLEASGEQLGTCGDTIALDDGFDQPAKKSDGIMGSIGEPSTRVAANLKRRRKGEDVMIDDDIRSMFLAPTQYDPLSFRTSDLILDLAKKHNANVAVVPPDRGEQITFGVAQEGTCDLQSLEHAFNTSIPNDTEPVSNLSLANGWLIGGPVDPLTDIKTRYSRSVGEDYLNAVVERGYPTIQQGADLEQALTPDTTRYSMGIARVCLRIETYPWSGFEEQRILAFYGTLDSKQESLASTEVLRLTPDQLSNDQFRILQDVIINSSRPLEPEYPPDWPSDAPYTPAIPADMVGDGFPSGTTIDVTYRSIVMGGFRLNDRPNEKAQYENLNSVAFILANKTDPNSWVRWYDLNHLLIAQKTILNMRVKMGNYVWEDSVEEEPHGSKQSYDLNAFLNQLSNEDRLEFTKQYQQALAERGRANPDSSPPPLPDAPPPR